MYGISLLALAVLEKQKQLTNMHVRKKIIRFEIYIFRNLCGMGICYILLPKTLPELVEYPKFLNFVTFIYMPQQPDMELLRFRMYISCFNLVFYIGIAFDPTG